MEVLKEWVEQRGMAQNAVSLDNLRDKAFELAKGDAVSKGKHPAMVSPPGYKAIRTIKRRLGLMKVASPSIQNERRFEVSPISPQEPERNSHARP